MYVPILSAMVNFVNDKYQKRWVEQNFANVFILTNNSWAIQASMHARRFFVLRPRDTFSGRQTAKARAYFDKLLAVSEPSADAPCTKAKPR
jgi:hypothetical protein